MKRRVVITGMGVVSPIGSGDLFWENVKKGTCGINFIESFDTTDFSVKIAAEVKDCYEYNTLGGRTQLRVVINTLTMI